MLQEIEETTPTTRKLKINIPSSVIEEEITNAYNKLRVSAKIPGFRVGKVPRAILEKKFGNDIEKQVMEKIVPEFYLQAVKEAKITPVTYPNIDGNLKIVRNQPLSFTAAVEIKPEVENLNYEGIVLKEKTFSVEENEIETAIKTLRESKALFKVTECPVREGDIAIIDCDAFIDSKEVKELQLKDYTFILGSRGLPNEFSEALSGRKKGENSEIKINFEVTHPNKTIAGKEVLFKTSITETKEKILPDLDDEFAKGFNCSDVEELKKKIYENIYNTRKNQINNEYKKELINYLITNHDFEVPPSMVNRELEFLIYEAKQEAMRKGVNPPLPPFDKGGEGGLWDEELRKEHEPKARENVKGIIILDAIGRKEKIEISDDDIKQAIDEIAAQNELKPEEVKKLYIMKEGSLDGLKNRLYTGKVLDFVLSKAIIKNTDYTDN
jgi:trigger factor